MLIHYGKSQKSFELKNHLVLAKNDLVLFIILYEENQRRQKWLLGKIADIIPGQVGQVRGAKVLLGKSRNTVDRYLNRLYLLEANFKFVLKNLQT